MGRLIDLTGQRFDRLTVLYRTKNHITSGCNSLVMWKCQCDCGNITTVLSGDLRSGSTKSCGCYNLEKTSKRMKENNCKFNEYELCDDYYIGYDCNNRKFYIDFEDYKLVSKYCWHVHHTGYVMARKKDGTSRRYMLHKYVMGSDGYENLVDHKDGNKQNCRKSNLRIGNHSKNNMNQALRFNNKSGVKGVHWHNRDSVWEVAISVNKKKIYLGRYSNFNEAIKVRKQAEEKYHGEWSYDNSRNKKESI